MQWKDVGNWLKDNAGKGAALVGSLASGNVPGAIAAGVSLISSATGTDDPERALEMLQTDPAVLLKLKELCYQNEEAVRGHLEEMTRLQLEDEQKRHSETQQTIRSGDNALDQEIRRVRPFKIVLPFARALMAYCLGSWVFQAFTGQDIFSWDIAFLMASPVWAYMGLREVGKGIESITGKSVGDVVKLPNILKK